MYGGITVAPDDLHYFMDPSSWNGMRMYKATKLIQTQFAFGLPSSVDCNVESVAVSPGTSRVAPIAHL